MRRSSVFVAFVLACLLCVPPVALAQGTGARRRAASASGRFDRTRLATIPAVIEEAVARKDLPGAVVAVGTETGVEWQASVGRRAIEPQPEPMTADTIFDAASLTKVVATTTSVMMLVEQGKLRLTDRVASLLPGFEKYGKRDITIRQLLTHTSGLRPDL
jgi:CubicO group peptidase (beta-lactamase class C family)